jgi:formamidopyrimidine-DNA glycosylase
VPELPEVETVRRGLEQLTLGQPILSGEVLLDRTIAYPALPAEFLTNLQNTQILTWHRRGKYLLAELGQETGDRRQEFNPKSKIQNPKSPSKAVQSAIQTPNFAGWLGVHLRMTGQLLWLDRTTVVTKHTRVRLFFPGHWELRYVDQRTFGRMWWVPPDRSIESIITGLQTMGPEPFSDAFSVSYLVQQLRDRQRPIKNALLDQALVAGVGNIYADEALFLSQIRPETLCAHLTRKQIERLRSSLIQVLQTSIEVGGTTFSTFLNVRGVNGNYSSAALVYGRDGEACTVCGTIIQRLKLAGRSAHFCPQCQR